MNVSMFQWSLRTATARPMRPLAISPVCKKVAPSRLLKPQAVLETRPSKADKDMLKLAKKQEKAVAKVKKAEMKAARKAAEDRGALYFLHWHNVSPSTVIPPEAAATKGCTAQTQKYIATLQEELKRMEDVSEDALWYVTKEAEDGMHVLLVTGHAKDGLKYGLQELPAEAETHSVQLGAAGEMVIPVASLRALLMKQRAEEMMDSSDEEEEAAPGGMMSAAVGVALMDDAKQQKKMLKQEEKRMKEEEKRMKKEKKMGMAAAVKESMAMVEDSDSDSEDEDCMGATSVCVDAKQGVSGLGEVVATGVVEEDPVAREHARQLLGQMGSKVDAKMTKMEKAEEEDSGSCCDEDSSESSSESDSETMEDEGKVGTRKEQQRVSVA